MQLAEFCNKHNLNLTQISGVEPTSDGQYDKYAIIGNGLVNGLQVDKYGEFGNNIIQLIHSVYLAQKWRLGWVQLNNFGPMFIPGVYKSSGNVKIIVNSHWEPLGESALAGRYFFWWGTGGALRNISPEQAVRIVREDVRPFIDLPRKATVQSAPTIQMHIRGGSDIFGSSAKELGQPGVLNAHYVQPPLEYYKVCLHDFLARNPGGHVIIMSMDRANPCVDALEEYLRSIKVRFDFRSGSVKDDISSLYNATEIVAGWGTFIPMISLLSENVKKVFFFRDPQQAPRLSAGGAKVVVVGDVSNEYMQRGSWKNTPEQRKMMLDYPVSSLKIIKN